MSPSLEKSGSPPGEGRLAMKASSEGLDTPAASLRFAEIDEKRLVRRIDLRVMPILFVIYIAAFLDRVNISNALTMSLTSDLGLVGQQANIALTIFFVPYVIFEIPSNILMKKFQPHIWLSGCILVFGIVMLCQGFVQSYGGLLATRFLLGLAEAGIFPGSFYLISFWYGPDEIQKRFTIYWSSVILAGAFGSLLATGISYMDGVRGLANWRWIFILEGIVTIIIGLASFFLVTDFPRDVQWLTETEKEFVIAKTKSDEEQAVSIGAKDVLFFFKDPKNVLGAIMYFGIVVPVYAFSYFTPTIVKSLGYSVVQTQLRSVPPFAAAFGLCLVAAYISDSIQLRYPFVILGEALLITGLAILMTIHGKENFSAEYAGICLVCMGAFCAGASIVCWYLMNLRGHIQRSIGSAWMISFGNTGGIVATFTFLKEDAPLYHTGYSVIISTSVLGTFACLIYGGIIWRERRQAAKLSNDGRTVTAPSL